jgi:hypothetical protein
MTSEVIELRRSRIDDPGEPGPKENAMSLRTLFDHPDLLRRVLLADALLTGMTGLALWLGKDLLAAPLGLPRELLAGAGLALLPFVAFVFWLSRRARPGRAAVWAVIAINALWVIESVWLLVGGSQQPSALGHVFVLGQALAVALLAELEYVALRRASAGYA